MISRIARKAQHLFDLHVRRDSFLREADRWFRDRGDETLRLDYPLDSNSNVVDVGGYQGDFADAIYQRFGCNLVIFEPVSKFYSNCVQRFSGNDNITVINCGLGAIDTNLIIEVSEDASSLKRSLPSSIAESVKVRRAEAAFAEIGLEYIDVIKINIEGGEYDLLLALIESGWIKRVRYLQVQFHNFVPDAISLRNQIRTKLSETHEEMWNYEFIWESWCLRT
jgi:FkbM family methyltransferase